MEHQNIVMEYKKKKNVLGNIANRPSKFRTKN